MKNILGEELDDGNFKVHSYKPEGEHEFDDWEKMEEIDIKNLKKGETITIILPDCQRQYGSIIYKYNKPYILFNDIPPRKDSCVDLNEWWGSDGTCFYIKRGQEK